MSPTSTTLSILLALSLVAVNVNANPLTIRDTLITLPLAKKVNMTGGSANLVQIGQARAKAFRSRADGRMQQGMIMSVPVENQAVTYVASVGVGSPPTTYSLVIDTGSSNTWVGANKPYTRTSAGSQTDDLVEVMYGSGAFAGREFLDEVSFGSALKVTGQSIGIATTSKGFHNVDGILGIGLVDLTEGTLVPHIRSTIPTIIDNLLTQGTISKPLLAISFEPTTLLENVNGELTFGGTDPSKYTGSINYVPLTTTSPSAKYWGIDQSITYGSAGTTILSQTAGIVDTGTSLILIASDAFDRYMEATGGVEDASTGLLRITSAQYANLQSLYFKVGGVSYELTPNAQIWPRSLNGDIGGTASGIYLIVANIGSPSGEGLDFVNGFTFLERFYSVYDSGSGGRVGLAATPFTHAATN
ncbi:hypothetical protein JAAARDRAFT_28980 [Jaapia argillacea MUCL 33604]|uniref:Peptidase A1 domain-containing protein n=1 Tax=Jaapia argillacea MUCL 33604 TaxID=933084 RepID=A0A067Q7H6_9AGAM|nr:hypothetical protein JAAARDRAFT_28980 [Jaapia argillacea MUCL 33604]